MANISNREASTCNAIITSVYYDESAYLVYEVVAATEIWFDQYNKRNCCVNTGSLFIRCDNTKIRLDHAVARVVVAGCGIFFVPVLCD